VNESEEENAEFTRALMNEVQQKTAQLTDALDLLTQAYDDTLEAVYGELLFRQATWHATLLHPFLTHVSEVYGNSGCRSI
jgi:hypothetical protein